MGPITATGVADAPRERVFDLIVDLSIRPSFTDHFLGDFRLVRLQPRGVGAGIRFRVNAGARPWMETVIADVDRPHRILERGWTGRNNRIGVAILWELTEGPGAVTTASVSFHTEPSNPFDQLGELLAGSRWTERQWERAARRLAALSESNEPPPRKIEVAGGDPLGRLPVGVR